MFKHWLAGAKTVIGVRESREDSSFSRLTSRLFYRLMRRYAVAGIPVGGFDFFLLDRTVIERLQHSSERNGFLQGQILAAGGKIAQIPYKRRARKVGKSGWTAFPEAQVFCRWLCCLFFRADQAHYVAGHYRIHSCRTAVSVALSSSASLLEPRRPAGVP